MFSNVSIFFSASCDLLWSIWQVGYLLGLGDRHPSNLMLDRHRYISPCSMPFFAHLGWRIDCWLQISWYPYNFLFHVHNIYGFKISRHAFLSFSFYSKLFPKQEFITDIETKITNFVFWTSNWDMQWEDSSYWLWGLFWGLHESRKVSWEGKAVCMNTCSKIHNDIICRTMSLMDEIIWIVCDSHFYVLIM